jgi:hypothetical protein
LDKNLPSHDSSEEYGLTISFVECANAYQYTLNSAQHLAQLIKVKARVSFGILA